MQEKLDEVTCRFLGLRTVQVYQTGGYRPHPALMAYLPMGEALPFREQIAQSDASQVMQTVSLCLGA
jgi:hypothetical protein